ncbi:MAG TPA: response regulator [Thermoanaerobaculia bacterium]|jgi:CheY-like chemotaxis protein
MPEQKPLLVVVEDDETLRSLLVESLQAEGYEVTDAPNGAAALQKIRTGARRPDLILLDLQMPILNGWEFLAIREGDPVLLLIPVIILSAENEVRPELGSVAVLKKPIDLAELSQLVGRVLEESAPDPERLPRRSEPWSVHDGRSNVIRNSLGRIVAYVRSEREARRIVAAVNGTSRISTEALESGIVDRGLECLYQLNQYDTDEAFRRQLDAGAGIAPVITRRGEIAALLRTMAFAV